MRRFLTAVFVCVVFCLFCGSASGQAGDEADAKVPSYECLRIENNLITINGELTESCWETAPLMPFRGLVDGSEPPLQTFTRLLWDDNYLYVGCDVRDPEVWARAALRDEECSKEYADRAFYSSEVRAAEWRRLECNVMHLDKFVKILIDPDADGKRYLEFQVNPLNTVFDAWYEQGFKEKWGDQDRGPNIAWTCSGLVTAAHVEGTLNAPHDVDQGWCLEMAIPWKAIAPFAKGACPPKAGDVWTAHLGRIHKEKFNSPNIYWTWPVIGSTNSHLPHAYGEIMFRNDKAQFNRLMAWGARGNPKEFVPKAADIGVTDIMSNSHDPEYLAGLVEVAKEYNIGVYAVVMLNADTWKKKHPGKAAPVQQMNEEENKILTILQQAESRRQLKYQWGEEPVEGQEVLIYDVLCFHHPEVKELLKEQIREILAVPGIAGIAFDGFGYQNYRCCRCPLSVELFRKGGGELEGEAGGKAFEEFSLDTLVAFNNELADYARTIKADVKITNHVWPVFLPDPLYGNRLDIDYCGQTAAWFFPWELKKVEDYTRTMVLGEKKHYPRTNAAALIGFYNKPDIFPLKSPERIAEELDAILAGGCTCVQVCDITDVLDTPEIAAVFRRYFKKPERP